MYKHIIYWTTINVEFDKVYRKSHLFGFHAFVLRHLTHLLRVRVENYLPQDSHVGQFN